MKQTSDKFTTQALGQEVGQVFPGEWDWNEPVSQWMIQQDPRNDLAKRKKDRQKLIMASEEPCAVPLTIKAVLSSLRAGGDLCKCRITDLNQVGNMDLLKFWPLWAICVKWLWDTNWKKLKILLCVKTVINTPGPKTNSKSYFIREKKRIWDDGLRSWHHRKPVPYGEDSKDSTSRFQALKRFWIIPSFIHSFLQSPFGSS